MQSPETYFEQIPLEMVTKIVEEQSPESESTEQFVAARKSTEIICEPDVNAGSPATGGSLAKD
jgi:hypothetical protein